MNLRYTPWYDAYLLLAAGGAVWTALGCGISPFWILLLFPAYLLGLCLAHILVFVLLSFVIRRRTPERIRPTFLRFYLHQTIMILLRVLRVRVHTEGKENLPKKGRPCLVVANHLSHFDPMVIAVPLFSHGILFISKPENLSMPVMGPYATRAGFIGIDRTHPLEAMKAVREAARRMREDACAVNVYPEGTISRDGVFKGFHDGVFLAAIRAGADVAVVTLRGTEKIKRNWYRFGTDVYVKYEALIPAEEVVHARPGELSERARELMRPTLLAAGFQAPPTGEIDAPDLSAVKNAGQPKEATVEETAESAVEN